MKKIRETDLIDRRHGLERPRNVSMEENMNLIEELVCSKEERPHTHLAPRKTAKQTGISLSSVQTMVKKKKPETVKALENITNERRDSKQKRKPRLLP